MKQAQSPMVSVLMTVYNREKYIAEAIESVLASSYTNFELIIVDDQSTDRSTEIAKKYAQQDSRIKVYVNEKNLGQFQNRNYAARLAKGKYIKYLDSDDIIYWYGLQVMVEAMEKFPEAAFAMPGIPNNKEVFPILCNGKNDFVKHFTNIPIFIHGPSALIFKTVVFNSENGFGSKTYVGSDTDIMLKLASKYNYLKIQPALIWWRTHDEQEILKGTLNYDYFQNYFSYNYQTIKQNRTVFKSKEYKLALKKLRNLYTGKIFSLIKKGNFTQPNRFINENPDFLKLFIKIQ